MTGPVSSVARRRALGYRILGRGFDYLLHLRPVEWPIVTVHAVTGTLLAARWNGLGALDPGSVVLGLALWVVCLNGGTLAINSAFDRDEGDVAYLRAPPAPPTGLFLFGTALMAFGFGAAAALPPPYRAAYAACMALSFLYSVPPVRLKAVAGFDWLINMWGFGTLTPFAGWAATGVPVDQAGQVVLLAFCPLFAALYPLTQLYQLEEDRRRADRTMATVLGERRSLMVAILSAVLAFALFRWAGHLAGWPAGSDGLMRRGLLLGAALSWAAVLLPWLLRADRLTSAQHQQRMYAALAAWAVTDVAVIYGFAR